MASTKLSSKGQVIIPAPVRASHHWEAGQELIVVDVGDGVLLKPKSPFLETAINEVAGCLSFRRKAKSLAEMDEAIIAGVKRRINDRG